MNLTKEECEKALERIVYLLCLGCQQIGGKIDGECFMKCIKDEKETLQQLINEYFDLIERIKPVQGKSAVPNEIEYHEDKKMIEKYVKYDIIEDMVKFLFKENVVEFRKEQDYSQFQTIHKGKIYIVKPKGDNDETN